MKDDIEYMIGSESQAVVKDCEFRRSTSVALPVEQQRADSLLGASQAAAALGLDRYRPPIMLWRQLRGMPVDDSRPEAVEEAARWGQALEPIIRGKYALERNVGVIVPTSSITMDQWLRATPDGFVISSHPALEHADEILGHTADWDNGFAGDDLPTLLNWKDRVVIAARQAGALGLVQVKTCSAYLRDEWADGVPSNYEIQVRVEMAVTNLPWCDVVCLIGGQRLVQYRVERDLDLERNILRDLRAFWDKVQSGVEPDVDGSDAWRQLASSRMKPSAVTMQADDDMEALIVRWLSARKSRKREEEIEEECKTRLLLKMSAAGATKVQSSHGVIPAYKTGGRTDWKGVAASLGCTKAPEKFVKPSTTWAIKAPSDEE